MMSIKNKLLYLFLIFLLISSCVNSIKSNNLLTKRVWIEQILQNDIIVSERISKVEYFDSLGHLTLDTVFWDSEDNFETNRYINELRLTSILKSFDDLIYWEAEYDSLGYISRMLNISNDDTSEVLFQNYYNEMGLISETLAQAANMSSLTTFEYNKDSTINEKITFSFQQKGEKKITKREIMYYNKNLTLQASKVISYEKSTIDSVYFTKDQNDNLIKVDNFMDGLLVSSESYYEEEGESVIEIVDYLDKTVVKLTSQSFFK